jgi:choline-sulfatase
MRCWIVAIVFAITIACSRSPAPAPASDSTARHLILITIDTLRADRVGAYGYARARTPRMDELARRGARFERAYAPAPITLPSHASMMTGRYPPGHGSRHNGMRVDATVPVIAEALSASGFAAAAFVGAFPLDRRFGLDRGFSVYGDRMPRGANGRLANERLGRVVVDEALAWLNAQKGRRVFLWTHLFEPHAPYGDPRSGRPVAERYDDEVAEADALVGRIVDALGSDAAASLIVVTSDHGEAFGEHGEISHSVFVYDTTLRVPLIVAGPGIAPRTIAPPVSLVDLAPTVLGLLDVKPLDADGVDLSTALGGKDVPKRSLYAESYAPLLDFGWSPLRALRSDGMKYIEAPRPEMYDVANDPLELKELSHAQPQRANELADRLQRYSPGSVQAHAMDREVLGRLQALGYASGSGPERGGRRADPKDRVTLAARISEINSGELEGAHLETALRDVLREDRGNPQANLRLGFVLLESDRCPAAIPFLRAAIAARVPTADAHLGLGLCQVRARQFREAESTLREADRVEPDNPVVLANLGLVLSDTGRHDDGAVALERAVRIDPDFHEARFNLARVLARAGRREQAARAAEELSRRLPPNAPQRSEVERLLKALGSDRES